VALTDFVIQRRKASQSIRMTKDEVKREFRESEGDPMIRNARRRRARQMAFARMMDAIPTSDVVVTNPTTLAVALKYDSLTMKAPKIMAKGQRLMADRIKQIARENNVPIIEDKPLARALFSRPIGAEVPAHLYRAVARLLVLVHQARFNAGRAGGARAGQRAGARGWAPGARGAGGGFAGQPWWNAAGSANSRTILNLAGGGPKAGDTVAAAQVYGGAAEPADGKRPELIDPAVGADVITEAGEQAAPDEAWLDDAALTLDDVDEDALAAALAEDELGDMTPDELAQLDASLVLGQDVEDEEDEPDTDDGEQEQ
jgi:type III secretion system FlhB-like substrate exporter